VQLNFLWPVQVPSFSILLAPSCWWVGRQPVGYTCHSTNNSFYYTEEMGTHMQDLRHYSLQLNYDSEYAVAPSFQSTVCSKFQFNFVAIYLQYWTLCSCFGAVQFSVQFLCVVLTTIHQSSSVWGIFSTYYLQCTVKFCWAVQCNLGTGG
jgi:hypothetical protein